MAARSHSRASSPPCPCARRWQACSTGVQARARRPSSGMLQLLDVMHTVCLNLLRVL